MSQIVKIEYFGFEGTGRTMKDAKADAGKKISALHNGSWTPVIISWRGETVLLTRDLTGWVKRFLQHDNAEITVGTGSQSFDSRDEAIRASQRHIVQLGWRIEDPIDIFPEWFTDKHDRKEAIEYRQWQLNYRELKDRGLNDNQAHRYASYPREHWPAGPEQAE